MPDQIDIIKNTALELAASGFSVIPVRTTKVPFIAGWNEFGTRIATPEEINSWVEKFGSKMQIGVVTGKLSGISVIDVEAGGNWNDLPETCCSKTGRNGRHFVYAYSDKVKTGARFWPLTDIRNDGGFIVIPPSSSDFGSYEWISALDHEKLTDFPIELFNEKSRRWAGLCGAYKGALEGSRHDQLTSRAGALLRRIPEKFWENEVWVQLQDDNNKGNKPSLEEEEVRQIFEGIGKKELARRAKEPSAIGQSVSTEKLIVHSCAEMLATPHVPDSFVIKPLVPEGMVSALTSQTGAGKSIIALEMARCIASGEPFLGKFEIPKKMPVLLLDQEMSPNTIVGRFHSLINDPTIPIFTAFGTTLKVTNPEDYKKIIEAINDHEIGLVIFDTLVTFHNGDENQVNEMRDVMEAMMRLCSDTGVTVLFLHHQRKGAYGEQTSQASMRGSSEIGAKVGCQMTLESKGKKTDETTGDTTAEMTLEQHKSRLPIGFEKFKITSTYNDKTGKSQITYGGEAEEKQSKKDEQKDKVFELLEKDPSVKMTRQEIIDVVGAQKNTDKAIAELVKEGKLFEEKQNGSKGRLYSAVGELKMPDVNY